MKRRNPVSDAELLGQTVRTYSAAVNRPLAETVRRKRADGLTRFFGTGLWQGDLREMRDDRPRRKRG